MDPLSLAFGVGGLISLAKDVYDAVWKGYLEQVIDAPREIADLHVNLKVLEEVLARFKDLLESDADEISFSPDSGLELAKRDCEKALLDLQRRLLKERKTKVRATQTSGAFAPGSSTPGSPTLSTTSTAVSSSGDSTSNTTPKTVDWAAATQLRISLRQRLTWPFKSEEISKTIQRLQKHCQIFSFCLNIRNCEIMAKSSSAVVQELEQQRTMLHSLAEAFGPLSASQADILGQIDGVVGFLVAQKDQLDAISKDVAAIKAEFNR
jgi:hypothetical protein